MILISHVFLVLVASFRAVMALWQGIRLSVKNTVAYIGETWGRTRRIGVYSGMAGGCVSFTSALMQGNNVFDAAEAGAVAAIIPVFTGFVWPAYVPMWAFYNYERKEDSIVIVKKEERV